MTSILNAAIRNIPIPDRMNRLPISETGFLVPWFVAYSKDDKPLLQVADPVKRLRAGRLGLCWCCGQKLGAHKAAILGPMCIINRITAEPASHKTCAEYSVRACPFLSKPRMRRNPIEPEGGKEAPPGIMIDRNPGVVAIWITRDIKAFRARNGGILYHVGEPSEVAFYAEGRKSSLLEIMDSINSGIPLLEKMAAQDGPDAVKELYRQIARAMKYFPHE
jgi:hypothetical protein